MGMLCIWCPVNKYWTSMIWATHASCAWGNTQDKEGENGFVLPMCVLLFIDIAYLPLRIYIHIEPV